MYAQTAYGPLFYALSSVSIAFSCWVEGYATVFNNEREHAVGNLHVYIDSSCGARGVSIVYHIYYDLLGSKVYLHSGSHIHTCSLTSLVDERCQTGDGSYIVGQDYMLFIVHNTTSIYII